MRRFRTAQGLKVVKKHEDLLSATRYATRSLPSGIPSDVRPAYHAEYWDRRPSKYTGLFMLDRPSMLEATAANGRAQHDAR